MGNIWCNKLLAMFNKEIYTGLVTLDQIPSNKIAVKYDIQGGKEEIWGWEIPFGTQKLFLPDKIENQLTLDLLPIKIKETEEFSYQKNVYLMVKNAGTFKVIPAKNLSIRKIAKIFCAVKHSAPEEYKDMVLLGLASYIYPLNWRLQSTAGFGKNNLFEGMDRLFQDVKCYQPRSAPKLKKESAGRSLLVSNEFMEIPLKDKKNNEDYYRNVGDNATNLENNALASAAFGTKANYDTDNLSSGVIYNMIDYYIKKKDTESTHNEFFDILYSHATNQRFLPLIFDKGEIDAGQFFVHKNKLQEEYDKYRKYYLGIVKSMLYWQDNFSENLVGKEDWKLNNFHIIGSKENRLNKHYCTLLEFLKGYSETPEEYNKLADRVWDRYTRYLDSIKPERIKKIQESLEHSKEESYDAGMSEELKEKVTPVDLLDLSSI